MIITNRRTYTDLDWDAYCKLDGISFSTIKGFKGQPTEGMQLGTLVHNFISEPEKYNGEQKELVIPLARALYLEMGTAAKYGRSEVAVSSVFSSEGMSMVHKGRIDRLFKDLCIDFKVIKGQLKNYIQQFGYDHQINGYVASSGTKYGMIIAIDKSHINKPAQVQLIKYNEYWWESKIREYGRVMA